MGESEHARIVVHSSDHKQRTEPPRPTLGKPPPQQSSTPTKHSALLSQNKKGVSHYSGARRTSTPGPSTPRQKPSVNPHSPATTPTSTTYHPASDPCPPRSPPLCPPSPGPRRPSPPPPLPPAPPRLLPGHASPQPSSCRHEP